MPKIIYNLLEEDCVSNHLLRHFCTRTQEVTTDLSFKNKLAEAIKHGEIDLQLLSADECEEFLTGIEVTLHMYSSQGERGMKMLLGVQDIVSRIKTARGEKQL
ncbi:hypothetical protein MF271_16905 [Deinococcus sp. KNUC1210]|uniref:hypothetical protein n=1 Tax=Deinococcus sp. KNUC1210 TaxID=2917691 RepID=UPI001EF12987|nr:hypothetical protein [Deinococcus sp. KNUC1210]ULH15566.1 hypothetical protein MF271_16905 [Deinococcus sp. KNUC1210]